MTRFLRTRRVFLGAFFLSLFLGGCAEKKFPESISSSFGSVIKDKKVFGVENTKNATWLSWQYSVRLLKERNLSYLRAKEQLREIEEERESFSLRVLDPRLRVVTSLGTALNELSSLDGNAYGLRLLGTINIPSPATYYARRYALELQYYNSQLDLELLERRLIISLYGHFLRQQELEGRRAKPPEFTFEQGVETHISAMLGREQREQRLRQEAEQIRLDLNRLLDTPGHHWVCRVPTMPQISYVNRLAELDPEKGYGRLALKQAAGQVEAGILRVKQVKLRKWPVFSTGVSLPTLYNSQIEEDFDPGNSSLFASFGKSFEFTGAEARSLKSAQLRAEFVQRALRQRLERESSRLRQMKMSYQRLQMERNRLLRTREWLGGNAPSGSSEQLITHINELEKNTESLLRNESNMRQLDLQFWVWDEHYWKKK